MKSLNYLDLFAGAGGLSEGFIREGFQAIAHVEMVPEACNTLKTRLAFHHLQKTGRDNIYQSYLEQEITRDELWNKVPMKTLQSVINSEISDKNITNIFRQIDILKGSGTVDVIIGGPPCQAYSLAGRSRDPKRMEGDKRNFLFRYYAQFLKRYTPKYFVFENVLGLLTAGKKEYLGEMLKLFSANGYSVDFQVLNAEDYGVLQRRRRVVIIGKRSSERFLFPVLKTRTNAWQIKKDLLYDLPPLHNEVGSHIVEYAKPLRKYLRETGIRNGSRTVTQHIARLHNPRDLEIYSIAVEKWLNGKQRLKYSELDERLQTHKNIEAFLDRYKVVDPFGHSHTIVAHIHKDGHYYIFPGQDQVRSLSVREAARIQSFPDDYFFEGGRTAAFKQIGNAVPPLMAQSLADAIKGALIQ